MEESVKRKKRKRRVRAKWNRRLLPQVGLIIALIFVLTIVASTFIQVKGSMSTYLEAKKEVLRPIGEHVQETLDQVKNGFGFFCDLWENHPLIAEVWPTTEADDPFYVEFSQSFELDDNGFPIYDPEKLSDYTDREAKLLAIYAYNSIMVETLIYAIQQDGITFYLLDVRDEKWGTGILVLDDYKTLMSLTEEDSVPTGLAEDYSEFLNTIPEVREVVSQGKPMFARYDSPKDGEYYYLYISPVKDAGKMRAVQIISYNWGEYRSGLIKKQILISVITGLVLVGAAALLLYFITRSAIRPLGKIQQGVRSYIQNKDSTEVTERMGEIRQQNEFGVLADDVSQLAEEIDRYTQEITHLTGERERVAAELSLAANIQLGVLPVEFPDVPDYQLYATMTPAKEVGGDLYDFFDIDETHLGLVIGDVSGKGVPASLFMMIAKLLIREYAMAGGNPAEVLGKANKTLCENNKNEMFVTAWFGILDRTTGKIIAASAGHEFPILRDPDGEYRLIKDKHGFVLGGMDISRYRDYELELKPGGTILVYTDGAPEATNASDELFGTDRMLESLNRHLSDPPRELVEHLKEDIDAFVGDAPQFDDLTALCVQWNGSMK